MTERVRDVLAAYRTAFVAHVERRDETTLCAAYDVGRRAASCRLSLLEIAAVHHDALAELLRDGADAGAREHVVHAAAEFLVEALSPFEMLQRNGQAAREGARTARTYAAALQTLSSTLADTSLAGGAAEALEEVLHLVAEQTRELVGAASCDVRLEAPRAIVIRAVGTAGSDDDAWDTAEEAWPDGLSIADARDGRQAAAPLTAPLLALDGHQLGWLQLWPYGDAPFEPADCSLVAQIAEMAAAAIERALRYVEN